MEKNFGKRVEFIKYNSISQMVSNFIIEAEMHTISRPSNKTGVFISGVLFYSHELTFTCLKKIIWIIITAVRWRISYPEGFKPLKIPTNTISQIPNPLQINSQYNFQKIQPTKSHKTTNTTTPLNTKQPKPPTTKRAGAARSVHPWGADRKNAQVGRVTQLVRRSLFVCESFLIHFKITEWSLSECNTTSTLQYNSF